MIDIKAVDEQLISGIQICIPLSYQGKLNVIILNIVYISTNNLTLEVYIKKGDRC